MPVNRIARHLDDAPPSPAPPPPTDYRGRHEFLSDAFLRAVAAVTRLLDDDPAVVLKAAQMILDVEKTRLRHGRRVLGVPDPDHMETVGMLPPLPGDPDYRPRTVSPDVAAELEQPGREYDEFDRDDTEDDDFDDEPAIRPIRYVMGVTPTAPVVAESHASATEPLDPDDDEPADGQAEYERWVSGYYSRDRAPVGRMAGTPGV